MPAIDFPAAPAVNDEYSFEGRTWRWNGTGWEVKEYPAALLAGTAANPSLYFTSDPNTGLYSPGADQVAISTGGTGRLFVDASGNVNLGQLSSALQSGGTGLTVYGSTSSEIKFLNSTAGTLSTDGTALVATGVDFSVNNREAGSLVFGTSNTERARIDSAGRLLVGTSTSTSIGGVGATVQIRGATGREHGLSITRSAADVANSVPLLYLANEFNPAGNGTGLGIIGFAGHDGTDVNSVAATIRAEVDGTPGANDMPGRLIFATTADGASSPTERMRIDSAGTTTLTSAAATAPFIAKISTTEVARIDSAGRLLVGTTTSRSLGAERLVQIEGTSSTATNISVVRNANDAAGSTLVLGKSRGTSNNSVTIVNSDDTLGAIGFYGADGATLNSLAAQILCSVDGTPGANDMPGRLVFSTSADGTIIPTERMRITSAGNMLLGGTASPTSAVSSFCIFNGTAPTASVANGVVLYAEDVSSSSELKVRDEAGNVTTLSPHNFDLIPEGPSEDMAWSYYSERDGKRINVDMLKAIRLLEQLTGEKLVYSS